jgi:hypothetical protein
MWLRIAMLTSKGTVRSHRPWISRTGALMPDRSGGRHAGLCRDAHLHLGYAVDQV